MSSSSSRTEVFEYALIRVVPRVERGEAINAGVLVYSKSFRYLGCTLELDEPRLLALDPAADLAAVRSALAAFERACTEGPLADRPLGERFRWLTAPRSAMMPATCLTRAAGLYCLPAAVVSILYRLPKRRRCGSG
jgi:hypothetical protein